MRTLLRIKELILSTPKVYLKLHFTLTMIPLKFFKHSIQFLNLNVQVTNYLMLYTIAALFTESEPSSMRASDSVAVWIWNVPHRLGSLNTWILVGVSGKGVLLGLDLETFNPSHIQLTLSPEYRFSVPSQALSFSYHLSHNKIFPGETQHRPTYPDRHPRNRSKYTKHQSPTWWIKEFY